MEKDRIPFRRVRRKLIKYLLFIISGTLFYKFLKFPSGKSNILLKVDKSIIPENGVVLFRDKKIGIIKYSGVISVLDITCTHLGCTLNTSEEKFVCPCHGSEFDINGRILKGPATRDLNKMRFADRGEKIIIYET